MIGVENAIDLAALSLGKSLLLMITDGPQFYRRQLEIADRISEVASNRAGQAVESLKKKAEQAIENLKNKSAEQMVEEGPAFLTETSL